MKKLYSKCCGSRLKAHATILLVCTKCQKACDPACPCLNDFKCLCDKRHGCPHCREKEVPEETPNNLKK